VGLADEEVLIDDAVDAGPEAGAAFARAKATSMRALMKRILDFLVIEANEISTLRASKDG
jgi:hypothetical protein